MERRTRTDVVLGLALTALVVLSLCLARPTAAAPLNWEGTASWSLYQDHEPSVFVYGGGVATVNGSAAAEWGGHLDVFRVAAARGFFKLDQLTEYVTDPDIMGGGLAAYQFVDVHGLTGHVPGSFPGEYLPGTVPVDGVVHVCILSSACTQYLSIDLIQTTTLFGEPLETAKGIGIGGMLTVGGYGGIRFSIQAGPWTIKTARISTYVNNRTTNLLSIHSAHGWAHGPGSSTSSTANIDGMFQLVTPVQVTSNQPLGAGGPGGPTQRGVATIVTATIRFVPEPGLALLLGAGVAGLAMLARVRR